MLKFWFVYRLNNWSYRIIYDGNPSTLRDVADKEQAKEWYSSWKDSELQTVSFNHLRTKVEMRLPVVEWEIEWQVQDVSKELNYYLVNIKGMSAQLLRVWAVFFRKYFVVSDWFRIAFKKKEEKDDPLLPDWGLMKMKEFIFWLYRFDPITILPTLWKSEEAKAQAQYLDIAQHFDWQEHSFNGEARTFNQIFYTHDGISTYTPLYGVYAPQVRELMLWETASMFWGRTLQKWQFRVKYEMWEETYLAVNRESGKTIVASDIVSEYLMRTVVDMREKVDWNVIQYYAPSKAALVSPMTKIMNMNKKLRQGRIFREVKWWPFPVIYFMDGNEEAGRIEFLTAEGIEPGRGARPKLIVVDEAAYVNREVLSIIQGNSWVPKLYISTIDEKTKRNWFFEWLIRWEMKMAQYKETTDDLIVRLRKQYGMDKLTYEELQLPETHQKLADMRREFFYNRPIVGMRYTLDDNEHKSEREKEEIVNRWLQIWLSYLLASQYSEYLDETSVFQTDRCRIEKVDVPEEFECIVMSYDHAESYDNPVLSIGGLSKWTVYLLDSIILPKWWSDVDEAKLEEMQNADKKYYQKYKCPIYHVWDCGQAARITRAFFEDRWWIMDMALKTNSWSWMSTDRDWFHLVGKWVIVDIVKTFFNRGAVRIPEYLDVDEWIFDELANFQATKNENTGKIKYQAIKGKDDQVMALCYLLYFLHENWLKDEFAMVDVREKETKNLNTEELGEYLEDQRRMRYKDATMDKAYMELFGMYWW